MPSIYPQLKDSDRTFIRTEKARIRRQFLDRKKQEELITQLYQRFLGSKEVKSALEAERVQKAAAKPGKKKEKVKVPAKNKKEKAVKAIKAK